MGITEEEVEQALNQQQPPYQTNKAIRFIHEQRKKNDVLQENQEQEEGRFVAAKGLRIRKYVN